MLGSWGRETRRRGAALLQSSRGVLVRARTYPSHGTEDLRALLASRGHLESAALSRGPFLAPCRLLH